MLAVIHLHRLLLRFALILVILPEKATIDSQIRHEDFMGDLELMLEPIWVSIKTSRIMHNAC